ncbi:MAG TPA: HAD family hydrolase [Blastocatellia bacterium]|nr:HAD family hydrolase [Blastocatellia bacterium]
MNKIDNLLFDLDGTLIDSRADLARSINLMLADLDRPPLSEERVAAFVGDGVRVLVKRSLTATDKGNHEPDPPLHARGVELMHKHYADQMLVTTQLFEGVAETLRFFESKKKAVVTSKEVKFARIILDHFDISHCFEVIVGGDTLPARKPDPGPVIEALKQLNGAATSAVMIGDSENDILAGKGAGTLTCGLTYGFRTRARLAEEHPDVLIDGFGELRQFFI